MSTGCAPFGRYAVASLGLMAIASANGAVRDLTYGRRLSTRHSHLLSLVPAVAAFGAYASWLHRRWPIPTPRGAAEVGLAWAGMGLAFELALGRGRGASWRELKDHYDPTAAGTGLLVLAGAAASPVAARIGRKGASR